MKCGQCNRTIGEPGHLMYLCPETVVPQPKAAEVVVPQGAGVVPQETKQHRWVRLHPDERRRINREGQARRRAE